MCYTHIYFMLMTSNHQWLWIWHFVYFSIKKCIIPWRSFSNLVDWESLFFVVLFIELFVESRILLKISMKYFLVKPMKILWFIFVKSEPQNNLNCTIVNEIVPILNKISLPSCPFLFISLATKSCKLSVTKYWMF